MCASGRYESSGSPERRPFRAFIDYRVCRGYGCLLTAAATTAGGGSRRCRATATAARDRGAHAARADTLHGFEVHDGLPVVQDRAQFGVSCIGEIALSLDHFI